MCICGRVSLWGKTFSNSGCKYGQHAIMMPVLICEMAHIIATPIRYVTSPPYATSVSTLIRTPQMMILLPHVRNK